MQNKYSLFLYLSLLIFTIQPTVSLAQTPSNSYPKVVGYAGLVHPLFTFDSQGSTGNFGSVYTVGMPVGINILKSDHIGASLEFVPFVRSDASQTRVSNFLFHPGIMFRFKHGFTFVGRAAFETSGRLGFTPVFNKVIKKEKIPIILSLFPYPFVLVTTNQPQ
jgi:hypothetical protein